MGKIGALYSYIFFLLILLVLGGFIFLKDYRGFHVPVANPQPPIPTPPL